MVTKEGRKRAINVTGCSGALCAFNGIVKSFNEAKRWGFIDMNGTDVFLLAKDCQDGRPVPGDKVNFDMEDDQTREGRKRAINVTGCSETPQTMLNSHSAGLEMPVDCRRNDVGLPP